MSPETELALRRLAQELLPTYSERRWKPDGSSRERTEWETGYNAAVTDIKRYQDRILDWARSLPEGYAVEVAALFADGRLFVSMENDRVVISVNCNDLFAWGCGDYEPVAEDQLAEVLAAARSGPHGLDKWVCRQRNEQPQPPVAVAMKAKGVWDAEMEALPHNHTNAEIHALVARHAAIRRE